MTTTTLTDSEMTTEFAAVLDHFTTAEVLAVLDSDLTTETWSVRGAARVLKARHGSVQAARATLGYWR